MKRQIDLNTVKTIATGKLPRTGAEYTLVLQTPANIDQMLALQDEVFAELPENNKAFIVYKTRDIFEKYFAQGNFIIGIVHDGQLIAQSVLGLPSQEHPETGMDMALRAKPHKISILQSMVVHPDYRGNNLMSIMANAQLEIAAGLGRTHAIAEVDVENNFSLSVLLKNGLSIHSISQVDTTVYNLHARIKPELKKAFNKAGAKKTVKVPHADLARQKKLLAKGYRGISYDNDNKAVNFRRVAKRARTP